MTFGRDPELERPDVRSLELGGHNDKDGRSGARLYLLPDGGLTLYCADSGWAVAMQIGEHVLEWRRWTTIAAEDVPRLVDGAADPLEAVRTAVVADGERNDAASIEGRLVKLTDARGVPRTFREYEEW